MLTLNVKGQRTACLHIGFADMAANLYLNIEGFQSEMEEQEAGMHLISITSASSSRSFLTSSPVQGM